MKKCTRCFIIKPIGEFRARIRKNARGPKEERITHCRDCEKDAGQIRRKKQKPGTEVPGFTEFEVS